LGKNGAISLSENLNVRPRDKYMCQNLLFCQSSENNRTLI
jgi:hypothetical protein